MRGDTNCYETPWYASRNQLPPEQFTWQVPNGADPGAPALGKVRKVGWAGLGWAASWVRHPHGPPQAAVGRTVRARGPTAVHMRAGMCAMVCGGVVSFVPRRTRLLPAARQLLGGAVFQTRVPGGRRCCHARCVQVRFNAPPPPLASKGFSNEEIQKVQAHAPGSHYVVESEVRRRRMGPGGGGPGWPASPAGAWGRLVGIGTVRVTAAWRTCRRQLPSCHMRGVVVEALVG